MNRRRSKKGIGNVIATAVFIFLLIFSTGQLYVWFINKLDDYNAVAGEMLLFDLQKASEKIEITQASVTTDNNLNVTVTNTGGETVKLVSLWVINITANVHRTLALSNAFIAPGATLANIGGSLKLTNDLAYRIRVMTERGTSTSISLYPLSQVRLKLNALSTPPNPITGNNVTVTLTITNNETKVDALYNLQPVISVSTESGLTAQYKKGPTPSSLSFLRTGESAIIEWVYLLSGSVDKKATFNLTYANAPQGDYAIATALMRGVGGGTSGTNLNSGLVFFTTTSQVAPSGSYVIAGSDDNKAYFFGSDGSVLWSGTTAGDVLSVSVASNGSFTAFGGLVDNKVYLYTKSGTQRWSFTNAGGSIKSVAMTPDAKFVAAGTSDNKLYLFNVIQPGSPATVYASYTLGGSGDVVAFSADAKYVAVAGGDKKVYYFLMTAGTPPTLTLKWTYATAGNKPVNTVSVSEDGSSVAAGDDNKNVYLFYGFSAGPAPTVNWTTALTGFVTTASISQDGAFVIAGDNNNKVYLIEGTLGDILWSYRTKGTINSVDISDDGRYSVAGSNDKYVYFFSSLSPTPVWSSKTGGSVTSVEIGSDGDTVAAGSIDKKVYFWAGTTRLFGSPTPSWSYVTGDQINQVAVNVVGFPKVTVRNDGSVTTVLNAQTRILYIDIFGTMYAGTLVSVQDSLGNIYAITPQVDSHPIEPGTTITLSFSTPQNAQILAPSGSYTVYLRLTGFDETGASYFESIPVGAISF